MRVVAVVLGCALSAAAVSAAPCGATYYFKGGTQHLTTFRMSTTETVVSSTSNPVNAWLGGVTILDTHTVYEVVNRFTGSCAGWTNGPVTYQRRPAGPSTSFGAVTDQSLVYSLFGGDEYIITGCPEYWMLFPFKTNPEATVVSMIVGQPAAGQPFYVYYGTAVVADSALTRTGSWVSRGSMYFVQLYTLCDSAQLFNTLKNNLTASKDYSDTLIGRCTMQMLRLEFDTLEVSVGEKPYRVTRSAPSGVGIAGLTAGTALYDARGRIVARGADSYVPGPVAGGIYLVRGRDRSSVVCVPAGR